MKINDKKTEIMKVCDDPKPMTVTVAGCTLSETKSSLKVSWSYVQF